MGVSFKSSQLKASGGKKEGLEAAVSSGEAGLQGTRGAEEGERRWWRGWTVEGGKKRCLTAFLTVFLTMFLSANPTRDSREKITFF